MVFDPHARQFKLKKWRNIHVGEIVKLKADEFIPADLLILSTSDEKGICYIETKNLDGETNLKIKTAEKTLYHRIKQKVNLLTLMEKLNVNYLIMQFTSLRVTVPFQIKHYH